VAPGPLAAAHPPSPLPPRFTLLATPPSCSLSPPHASVHPRAWPGQPCPSPAAADVPAAPFAAPVHQRPEPPALSAQPTAPPLRASESPPSQTPSRRRCRRDYGSRLAGPACPPRAHVNVAFVVAGPDRLRVTASRAARAAAYACVTAAAYTRRGWLSEASKRSAARGRPPTGCATR
jgi:hypothetical protein